MNERLADWANVSQVVSGIAVVASLIYIAIEVRGNTSAQEAATIQAIRQDARAIAAAWPTNFDSTYFVPGFREYVDRWLAEHPLPE